MFPVYIPRPMANSQQLVSNHFTAGIETDESDDDDEDDLLDQVLPLPKTIPSVGVNQVAVSKSPFFVAESGVK
jgi:hypothetical protein